MLCWPARLVSRNKKHESESCVKTIYYCPGTLQKYITKLCSRLSKVQRVMRGVVCRAVRAESSRSEAEPRAAATPPCRTRCAAAPATPARSAARRAALCRCCSNTTKTEQNLRKTNLSSKRAPRRKSQLNDIISTFCCAKKLVFCRQDSATNQPGCFENRRHCKPGHLLGALVWNPVDQPPHVPDDGSAELASVLRLEVDETRLLTPEPCADRPACCRGQTRTLVRIS